MIPGLIKKVATRKNVKPNQLKYGVAVGHSESFFTWMILRMRFIHHKKYSEEMPINVGSGKEISIAKLAELIQDITRYEGALNFDC